MVLCRNCSFPYLGYPPESLEDSHSQSFPSSFRVTGFFSFLGSRCVQITVYIFQSVSIICISCLFLVTAMCVCVCVCVCVCSQTCMPSLLMEIYLGHRVACLRGGRLFLTPKRTSLVAQRLGICLPMRGTWVRSLVREDSTCHGATEPVSHNC